MENPQKRPPQYQVFINFRGAELRGSFIAHLVKALKEKQINVFIDVDVEKGEDLLHLFERIEQSRIALAVFSTRYTESEWCLDELVKIKECVDRNMLKVIPIFYKVRTSSVKEISDISDEFGQNFWRRVDNLRRKSSVIECEEIIEGWVDAMEGVARKCGFPLNEQSDESKVIESIVENVLKLLTEISLERNHTGKIGTGTGGSSSPYLKNEREPSRELSDEYSCNQSSFVSGPMIHGSNSATSSERSSRDVAYDNFYKDMINDINSKSSFVSGPMIHGSNSLPPTTSERFSSDVPYDDIYDSTWRDDPYCPMSEAEAMINDINSKLIHLSTQQPLDAGGSYAGPSRPRNNATSRGTKSMSQVESVAYASSHTYQDGQGYVISSSSSSINGHPSSSYRQTSLPSSTTSISRIPPVPPMPPFRPCRSHSDFGNFRR